jgi:hypothetical protein
MSLSGVLGQAQLGSFQPAATKSGAPGLAAAFGPTLGFTVTLTAQVSFSAAFGPQVVFTFTPITPISASFGISPSFSLTYTLPRSLSAVFSASLLLRYLQYGTWDASLVQTYVMTGTPRPQTPIAYILKTYRPSTGASPNDGTSWTGPIPGA